MDSTFAAALVGLAGILLGGGIQAVAGWWSDRRTAKSTLSALVAEVEGLVRLIRHRGFHDGLREIGDQAREAIEAGRPNELVPLFRLSMAADYFPIYKANLDRIGVIDPYKADRIVRFYLVCQALRENYSEGSPWLEGATARNALNLVLNDLQILYALTDLGLEIATFVERKPMATMQIYPEAPYPQPLPFIGNSTAELNSLAEHGDEAIRPAVQHELARRSSRRATLGEQA